MAKKLKKSSAELPAEPVIPIAAAEIASFSDALRYLHQRVNWERRPQDDTAKHAYKLDRMRLLCAALGHPERSLRCIHVAGTKGKGSTCEFIASMAQSCGLGVGLYTSPHILDIRERIRIGGKPVSPETFTQLCRQVALVAEAMEASEQSAAVNRASQPDAANPDPAHPDSTKPSPTEPEPATFFELMTAMALCHFAQEAVDLAVIEVGLGGLLDCTNVITPEVAVVTLIGRDHTQILGDTLPLIAAQKAGIFKPGVPAITYKQSPEVLDVFRQTAQSVGCDLTIVGEDFKYTVASEVDSSGTPHWMASIKTKHLDIEALPVPLAGEHQAHNLALALGVMELLACKGFDIDEERIQAGVESVKLPGRFQVLRTTPRIVLDVAHNPESVEALMKTLRQELQFDSLVMVFGCAADKDWHAMLTHLATGCDKVIFTKATGTPRAQEPKEMYRSYVKAFHKMAQIGKTVPDALRMARAAAAAGDVICITGSFYLVGEAKTLIVAGK